MATKLINALKSVIKSSPKEEQEETNMDRLKHRDEHHNNLISCGYARNTLQRSIDLAPVAVLNLISTYFRELDIWDITTTNRLITITDNILSTAETIGWPYRMGFGIDEISNNMIKKWYLSIPKKANGIKSGIWTVIGIVQSNKVNLNMNGNFYNRENNGYGLKGWDGALFHGSNKPTEETRCLIGAQKMAPPLFTGDKIVMILDMKVGTLRYVINGKDSGVIFKVDKCRTYRLCVALSKDSSIVLHK